MDVWAYRIGYDKEWSYEGEGTMSPAEEKMLKPRLKTVWTHKVVM